MTFSCQRGNQDNMWLGVTGRWYRNSLEEAISVDEMVLKWVPKAWIKMVIWVPWCFLRKTGSGLVQNWSSVLGKTGRADTLRIQITGEDDWYKIKNLDDHIGGDESTEEFLFCLTRYQWEIHLTSLWTRTRLGARTA